MNALQLFGCHASPPDGQYWWSIGAYLLAGRCSDGCHHMRIVVAPETMNLAKADVFAFYEDYFRRAFARVHPEAA